MAVNFRNLTEAQKKILAEDFMYVSDLQTEIYKQFAETVPVEELFRELRKITGINDLKFSTNIYEKEYKVGISIESEDIIDYIGFLKIVFSKCYISSASSIYYKKEGDYFIYSCTLFLMYNESEGIDFMEASYSSKGGWEFEYKNKI